MSNNRYPYYLNICKRLTGGGGASLKHFREQVKSELTYFTAKLEDPAVLNPFIDYFTGNNINYIQY